MANAGHNRPGSLAGAFARTDRRRWKLGGLAFDSSCLGSNAPAQPAARATGAPRTLSFGCVRAPAGCAFPGSAPAGGGETNERLGQRPPARCWPASAAVPFLPGLPHAGLARSLPPKQALAAQPAVLAFVGVRNGCRKESHRVSRPQPTGAVRQGKGRRLAVLLPRPGPTQRSARSELRRKFTCASSPLGALSGSQFEDVVGTGSFKKV